MENSFVVREWVKQGEGKQLHTHFEYGPFATYEEANRCAKMVGPQCFPQQLET
jgi:hypothetical protein